MRHRVTKQNKASEQNVLNIWTEQKSWRPIWKRRRKLLLNQWKNLVQLMKKGMPSSSFIPRFYIYSSLYHAKKVLKYCWILANYGNITVYSVFFYQFFLTPVNLYITVFLYIVIVLVSKIFGSKNYVHYDFF